MVEEHRGFLGRVEIEGETGKVELIINRLSSPGLDSYVCLSIRSGSVRVEVDLPAWIDSPLPGLIQIRPGHDPVIISLPDDGNACAEAREKLEKLLGPHAWFAGRAQARPAPEVCASSRSDEAQI